MRADLPVSGSVTRQCAEWHAQYHMHAMVLIGGMIIGSGCAVPHRLKCANCPRCEMKRIEDTRSDLVRQLAYTF